MTKITEKDALLRLTSLCARGEHCAHEMREKMRRWELTDDEQARVMEYLTDRKFVDDERYARAFVADKIKYGKWKPAQDRAGSLAEADRRRYTPHGAR